MCLRRGCRAGSREKGGSSWDLYHFLVVLATQDENSVEVRKDPHVVPRNVLQKVDGKSSETCSVIQRHTCVKAASTLKIQFGVKRIGLFFVAGANIWAATHKVKDPQNKNIITQVWPCMKVLPRLLDNPLVLCVQVKKNGLSERISQEERKRQEVGAAVSVLVSLLLSVASQLSFF